MNERVDGYKCNKIIDDVRSIVNTTYRECSSKYFPTYGEEKKNTPRSGNTRNWSFCPSSREMQFLCYKYL